MRLKKILKGRALSCNRTRSAGALEDRRSWSAPLCEVATHGCEAPLAAPFRLGTARYVFGRGTFTTLWSVTDYQDPELAEEETAGPEEFL